MMINMGYDKFGYLGTFADDEIPKVASIIEKKIKEPRGVASAERRTLVENSGVKGENSPYYTSNKGGLKGDYSPWDYKHGDRISFIMNLDKASGPGYHWVAVFIDPSFDRSLEYYNSFADEPSVRFMRDIKKVIRVLDPETYLKFKVNRVKQQRANSANCGFFSMRFLMDRYAGEDFDKATGFKKFTKSLIDKSEDEIKAFKKRVLKFEYV